jgi:hypothetical protein
MLLAALMRGTGPKPLQHTRNVDLMRYRPKDSALASRSPGGGSALFRFLCNLLVLALCKSAGALAVPFGRLFALYFWMGKSVFTLSLFVERQLLKLVGWLSGTALAREDSRLARSAHSYLGTGDVKRWHVGLGAWAARACHSQLLTGHRARSLQRRSASPAAHHRFQ